MTSQRLRIERCFTIVLVFHVLGASYLVVYITHGGSSQLIRQSAYYSQYEEEPAGVQVDISYNQSSLPKLNITNSPWYSAPMMLRALTKFEHDKYIQLLEVLAKLFFDANVTFIMCDGTLLGSYIGHDLLPWDDDLDLMVKYSDLPKVKKIFQQPVLWEKYLVHSYHDSGNEYSYKVLRNIPENAQDSLYYQYTEPSPSPNNSNTLRYHKFKFFYKDSPQAGDKPWTWPYIDIKFFKENDTHVWNLDSPVRVKYIERSSFYPLHLRPLSWLWLPAPKDTRTYLIIKYHRFRCRNSPWNHREEARQKSRKVRCWRLYRYYPFVWREKLDGGVLEVLRLDGNIIQYVGVYETYSVFQRPFAL